MSVSDAARIAILRSLRNPTEGQIAAAWTKVSKAKAAAGIARLGPGPGCREVWQAMIDVLIEEGTTGK